MDNRFLITSISSKIEDVDYDKDPKCLRIEAKISLISRGNFGDYIKKDDSVDLEKILAHIVSGKIKIGNE